jgi:beta-glucosidase
VSALATLLGAAAAYGAAFGLARAGSRARGALAFAGAALFLATVFALPARLPLAGLLLVGAAGIAPIALAARSGAVAALAAVLLAAAAAVEAVLGLDAARAGPIGPLAIFLGALAALLLLARRTLRRGPGVGPAAALAMAAAALALALASRALPPRPAPDLARAAAAPPPPVSRAAFPEDFLFGAATAAYQNEGDNTGSDMWDWERAQGWEPSGKAANSFADFDADLASLVELGANAYRFSIEWGRVFPEPGRPDEAALAYYARVLARLREAGIRPVVTIHHFTNPRWFWRRHPDGWRDPGAVEDFLDFVRLLAARFSGEVRDWITFNEPNVYLFQGYVTGYFPPGERGVFRPLGAHLLPAARNVVLAHRRAYALLHEAAGGAPARVGIALNIAVVEPWDDAPESRAAAEAWDRFFHWTILDGAARGRFDAALAGGPGEALDAGGAGLDFVGVNYYTRVFVRHVPRALPPLDAFPFYADVRLDEVGDLLFRLLGGRIGPGAMRDDVGREVYPEGIRRIARRAWERYGVPVLVTENGLPDRHDIVRADYVRAHLGELAKAVAEGIPVAGYLHWTLVDNYEWGSFGHKVGLFRMDREHGFRREITRGGAAYRAFLRGE